MALATNPLAAGEEAASPPAAPPAKVRICVIVAGAPAQRSWCVPPAKIEEMKQRLAEAEKNLGNVEFVVGQASNAAEVADGPNLLFNWGGGALGNSAKDYYASLHRVAYYGDHVQSIRHLAHLMGLRVVEEG